MLGDLFLELEFLKVKAAMRKTFVHLHHSTADVD
jgi:hypothetical protein